MSAVMVSGYSSRYDRTGRICSAKTERNIGRKTELRFQNRELENDAEAQRRKANAKTAAVRAFVPVRMVAVMVIVFACLWSPLQFGNEYLRSSSFEKVTVAQGESLQDIATRYTADPAKQKTLIDAISEVNALPKGEQLPAGWKLLVPVIK